jgi:hypothetical protein
MTWRVLGVVAFGLIGCASPDDTPCPEKQPQSGTHCKATTQIKCTYTNACKAEANCYCSPDELSWICVYPACDAGIDQ